MTFGYPRQAPWFYGGYRPWMSNSARGILFRDDALLHDLPRETTDANLC
jgi:hypothetical protein